MVTPPVTKSTQQGHSHRCDHGTVLTTLSPSSHWLITQICFSPKPRAPQNPETPRNWTQTHQDQPETLPSLPSPNPHGPASAPARCGEVTVSEVLKPPKSLDSAAMVPKERLGVRWASGAAALLGVCEAG